MSIHCLIVPVSSPKRANKVKSHDIQLAEFKFVQSVFKTVKRQNICFQYKDHNLYSIDLTIAFK